MQMTPDTLALMTDNEHTEEYKEFIQQFEPKRTTDDCFTPEPVYEAVADWVADEYGVDKATFIRPFYPGGDYEQHTYDKTDIVVDNPPFSKLAAIVKFYLKNDIKFFLFAPGLTLFGELRYPGVCAICVGITITYDNCAGVNTSFLTNLDTRNVVRTSGSLYGALERANAIYKEKLKPKRKVQQYVYPKHVITAAMMNARSRLYIDYAVPCGDAKYIASLDEQRKLRKSIFGGGLILSTDAAHREESARELEAKAREAKAREAATIVWKLSDKEIELINNIDKELDK